MHAAELCERIEILLAKNIRGNFPHDWDEDFITRSILKDLRSLLANLKVTGFQDPIDIKASSYKLTGTNESHHGDIAILINTKYKNGDDITGIAFLEAKKFYPNSSQFKAISDSQLKKILKRTPKSHLLLYDYYPIVFRKKHYLERNFYWSDINYSIRLPSSYSAIIQTNLALETKHKNRDLYAHSDSFTNQLVFRYLHSLDLEFDTGILNKIISSQPNDEDSYSPRYLINLSVGHGVEPAENRGLLADLLGGRDYEEL